MRVTNYIEKASNGLLKKHSESEWTGGREAELFSAFNDGGIECETGEFLYSLIRLIKPEHVLETGTHKGVGASYMGLACKDNGMGHVDTHEFLDPHYQDAKELIKTLGLDQYVTCHFGDVAQVKPDVQYQLILLDTEPQTRFKELIQFYNFLAPGGFLFIHDLHRHMHQIPNEEHGFGWPFGKLPKEIKSYVGSRKLSPFHFPTPRGLTGFYKHHQGDYTW